jgi:3-oxoadipate enol-lactonase / 4-carboxymuconolactone decarboxylase
MPCATTHRFAIGTATLEVITAGDPRAGLPLVLMHPTDAFTAALAEELAEELDGPIVCVHPRGVGASEPALEPDAGALEAMAGDVEAVRAQLGVERWIPWGMSGGGWIAQIYARRHPASTAGVVLESTCGCFRVRLADPACPISPFFAAWRPRLDAAGLIDHSSHDAAGDARDTEWIDVDGVGVVFRRRGGPALLVSPMALAPAMQRMMPALWTFDSRPWQRELRVPALVIAGDADPVAPLVHTRALHDGIAGSAFVAIEGGGHVPAIDPRPEVRGAVRAAVRRFTASAAAA